MHGRVQIVRTFPKELNTPEAGGYLMKVLEGHPGFRAVHLMLQVGSRQALNVTLWDSREDAVAASDRTAEVMGPRPFALDFDEVYEVLAVTPGLAEMDEATLCQVMWFDGPRSAAQTEALRRAGAERIEPAVAEVPGRAATYVLHRPEDSAIVVMTFATSIDALSRTAEAAFSTPLLPGEDPALLTGPDRIEIYTHEAHSRAEAPVA